MEIAPIVKWAGGKRQLLDRLLERIPKEYNNYFEPFIGGGAFLFGLQPGAATINDINKELINLYTTIKDSPAQFLALLDEIDNVNCDKDFYYSQREKYNQKLINKEEDPELAALFVWLNKHCFNGLYRVNQKGLFNVPYNNKKGISESADKENIYGISEYLKTVNIMCGDFEKSVETAEPGDFIYFDSPYAPINPTSFVDYTATGFSEEDHIRLSETFKRLAKSGCYCMLSNHDVPLIRELYNDYNIESVDVKRMINSDASNRTGTEVIIRNYI